MRKKLWIFVGFGILVLVSMGGPVSAAWHNETVDSIGIVGGSSSLALSSHGKPYISYYDVTNGDLKYAWKDASGWHNSTVDSSGVVGAYTSIALDNHGKPRISYWDSTNGDLKYAWMDTGGWHNSTVDSSGEVR